jgi:glucose-6-phosphate 1-dehydrogenase
MANANGVSPPQDIDALSLVVLGASGDLAKKKTFPAIFTLFASG